MSAPRPSRAVNLGYALISLALVAAAAFAVFQTVNTAVGAARGGDMPVGDSVSVPVQVPPERLSLPTGLSHEGWISTTVQVLDPTPAQELLVLVQNVGGLLLLIAVLWLLRGIVGSVRRGQPFGRQDAQRLRIIGSLLVVGAPLLEVLNTQVRQGLFERLPPSSPALGTAGYEFPGDLVLAGLGAYILAEVFAHGLRLQEDVEGTI